MSAPVDPAQAKVADRVAKLLAKAEGTDNEAEADTFMAAAQRLMARHSITAAQLRAARKERGTVDSIDITVGRRWFRADVALLTVVAQANDCRVAFWSPGRSGSGLALVYGFAEDLAAVQSIYGSLLIQLARLTRGMRSQSADVSDFRWTRNFRNGFAARIGERLAEARTAAITEAAQTDGSLLPVLADKETLVAEAMPASLRKANRVRVGAGFVHGKQAAERADIALERIEPKTGAR